MKRKGQYKIFCYILSVLILVFELSVPNPVQAEENHEITYVKQNDNEFALYGRTSGGKTVAAIFSKKSWGTWNIDGWHIALDNKIPSSNLKAIAAAGTDWEYTYRVADQKGDYYRFSGGNHGRERLQNIYLEDLGNNRPIDTDKKQVLHISNCLKIIEVTKLYSDDNFSSPYAEVTRTYYVKPDKIQMESKTSFIRDIYLGTSYVCMFPVSKNYGNNVFFEDTGHSFTTPLYGSTQSQNGVDNYIGKEAALSVLISGKQDDGIKFRVTVGSAEMVNNFDNELKTFYWDADQYTNKLYFSRSDSSKYSLVQKDTLWYQKNRWEMITN